MENIRKRKIGIIGCAGVGRTTLAAAIIDKLGGDNVEIMHITPENAEQFRKPNEEVFEIKQRIHEPIEFPIIEQTPKHYQNRHARRAFRKSKW